MGTTAPMDGALDGAEVALLEEWRLARAVSELALEHEWVGGGVLGYGGDDAWCSEGCGLGLRGPVSETEVDRLVSFYHDRGIPSRIELAPYADPDFVRALHARGFRLRGFESVFATTFRDGEDLRARARVPLGQGIRIARYAPDFGQRDAAFVALCLSGFERPDRPTTEADVMTETKAIQHERCVNVAAYAGDELVGVGTCEIATGVPAREESWRGPGSLSTCCLFGVTVKPEYRRRGIQQALIAARLEAARDAGCRLVCVGSAPGGGTERNAVRMGFRTAYTKVELELPVLR